VRVDQRISAIRVMECVSIGLLQSRDLQDQPKGLRLAMRIVMQNDGVFVNVILLYISDRVRGGELAPV